MKLIFERNFGGTDVEICYGSGVVEFVVDSGEYAYESNYNRFSMTLQQFRAIAAHIEAHAAGIFEETK